MLYLIIVKTMLVDKQIHWICEILAARNSDQMILTIQADFVKRRSRITFGLFRLGGKRIIRGHSFHIFQA